MHLNLIDFRLHGEGLAAESADSSVAVLMTEQKNPLMEAESGRTEG